MPPALLAQSSTTPEFVVKPLPPLPERQAQRNEMAIQRLNASNGLAENSVECMLQDHLGFLWLGTQNGLHKYDGYSFKVYLPNPDDPGSIRSRSFLYGSQGVVYSSLGMLYEDADKNLWIGGDGGLHRYLRDSDRFQHYPLQAGAENLEHYKVVYITGDPAKRNRLWVSVEARGLYQFDPLWETLVPVESMSNFFNGTARPEVTSIVCENDSILWVGTNGSGLLRVNFETERVTHHFIPTPDPHSISSNNISTIFQDRQGALWISTLEAGLNKLVQPTAGSSVRPAGGVDRTALTFTRYQHDPNDPHSLSDNNRISCIDEDVNGEFWIVAGIQGTSSSQLNRFNPKTSQVTRHSIDLSKNLVSVLVDRSGLIWAGSATDGVFKLNLMALKFPHYTMQPDAPISFYGKYIRAICEDRNGNIWLGSEMEGLYRLDRQNGEYAYFRNDPAHRDSLSAGHVNCIIADRHGAIWIGSNDGLHKFDPGKKVFKRYQHDPQNPHSLAANGVTSILEDRSGVLWVGNYTGTLHRFDPATEIFTRYREFAANSGWYSGAGIFGIREDDQGLLWLGTNGDGLVKFDPAIGKLKGFKKNSFDDIAVTRPLIDRAGRLWIGGLGIGGLALFDRKTETVTKIITEADGLLYDSTYGIEEDSHGNLWISSARGLSKYNPDRGTFHHYFKEDGLQDNEFRYWTHHKSHSGEVFFGGQYGFNAFYPDSIKDSDYVPPIVFTDLRINNRPVAVGKDSPVRKDIAVAEEIMLAYDQNDITITFAALDFSMPERNLYSFKLENYDEDWHAPSQERTAVYTNLDPGEYVFRAKGTNYDGVWNEVGAAVRVIVSPPWWRTWWAYTFYFAIIFGFFYGLRRYELNRQQWKHGLELERVESDKLKELDSLKSRFFANISHEFRTPLTLILGPIENLRQRLADDEAKQELGMMQRNGQRLLRLINQLLDLSRLDAGKLKLEARPGDLLAFLKGVVFSFESLAKQRGIDLKFQAPENLPRVCFDADKLEQVLVNLLSNAFKFTPEGGKIIVAINLEKKHSRKDPETQRIRKENPLRESEEDFAIITVTDNGSGISADRLPRIFDRFYTTGEGYAKDHSGSGIGSALTKELIELHHGEIAVTSEVGKGTAFTVRLPLVPAGSDQARRNWQGAGEQESHVPLIQQSIDPTIPQQATSNEQPETSDEQPASSIEQPTLLLVEDNADMRAYIRNHVKETHRVLEAEDGVDGFNTATELLPDLIISDVMMPKMDGYQLCEKLKNDERTSHIPIILLTAKSSGESKVEGLELGADDYLIKPFEARELQVRVKNLIEQRRKLRERFATSIKVEPKDITVTPRDAQFLQRAMDIVEANMSNEEFSVEIFGKEIGLSRSQLRRKIQALTDQSPTDFILTLRLKRAARLLQQQAGTVSEIAYEVGFNNLSYFARAFKKQFGHAPSEFAQTYNDRS
ncbi:response regulator [candidate division KSB1 bacterium]|nr:response regulator [candidate division KSB1 bacterium]